ncbi:hypothetical protein QYE76_029601 [Lolium multiflorum]|uniref:AT-hook motif nuclear-localized protein n=1 Tax=Lolium multiflorum TaxID=4521 RepID=A0AAD8VIE3_LOLMU|nr:hypothetical protein QYE76_029601 [Lolium multiflorum]
MSAAHDPGKGVIEADAHDDEHVAPLQTFSKPQAKRGRPRKYVDPSVAMPMPLAIVPAQHPTNDVLRPPVMPPGGATPTTTRQEEEGPGAEVHGHQEDSGRNGWVTCILSAHGALSNVTLRQGGSSADPAIYQGYFEMLSLSGSYQLSETDGMSSGTGGLSVSLASLDGRIFGGRVAGPLTAASPVQVVVGRFQVDENKKLNQAATGGVPGASSSTPRGALNGSSGSAQN